MKMSNDNVAKQLADMLNAGQYELGQVFLYYDMPLLYTEKMGDGSIWLVSWKEDLENVEQWLYLPISQDRLDAMVRGEIGVLQATMHPEGGFLYLMRHLMVEDTACEIEMVTPENLPEGWGISEEFFLPEEHKLSSAASI